DILGGVQVDGNGQVVSVEAIKLFYPIVKSSSDITQFEQDFSTLFSNSSYHYVKVTPFTERSINDESIPFIGTDLAFYIATIILIYIFVVTVLSSSSSITTRFWLT